jgi:ribosome-associated toxin RatA of RatAB toxin-antitoxin module
MVMRRGTFHYDIRARCRVEDAVALMADVPRLTSRHPLAVSVRELPPGAGVLRSTAVTSRLKLGPVGYHITYRADVMKVTADEVVTVAVQRPATTLVNHARFRQEDGGIVHIGVDISFESPALLFPYGFSKAKFAHHALAQGIKDLLEHAS